ncbi:DUF5403 family protein [Cnuibacter sp. UC19_7]|uniref:DUF5403 family protein n=1 Tax=Cnuibacter sp. UC19_7 TaxID=3350166 RepID=UPI00366ACC0F
MQWDLSDREFNRQLGELVSDDVNEVGQAILAEARADATRHRITGDYQASLKIQKGRIDTIVYSDSPLAGNIELGHISALPNLRGRLVWVRGLHILRNAATRVAGSRKGRSKT